MRSHQGEDLLHDHRREPGRGLVEQQQPGLRHQRAADRAHLLLAARHGAGELAAALLQAREQVVDEVEALGGISRRAGGMKAPMRRLSSTVMRGNRRRFSGTCAMPSSTMRCAGVAQRGRCPPCAIVPRVGRIRPEITRISVVLPAPFGPITRDGLAGVDLQRHAEQRLEAAVAGVDVGEAWSLRAEVERGDARTLRCRIPALRGARHARLRGIACTAGVGAEIDLDHPRIGGDLVRAGPRRSSRRGPAPSRDRPRASARP